MSDNPQPHEPTPQPAPPAPPTPDEPAGAAVTFTRQWGSYFPGEVASFTEPDAAALVKLGVATEGGTGKPPEPPPGFVSLASIGNPPRVAPPNPQHPELVQTYDPRPAVQMERAAKDADGEPGAAAREEHEAATKEVAGRLEGGEIMGAGPQPLPLVPPPPEPPAAPRRSGRRA